MAISPALAEPHLPFPADEREAAGADLQAMLVDLIDLSLIGKQAHWNVEGRHFPAVHAQLDELVDDWRSLEDEVAERAAAIGVPPDGRAGTVAATSEIDPLPAGALRDGEVVEAIAERLAQVVVRARERIHHAHDNDPVTEDLLIQVAATLEKQLWMIRVQRASA